jgi:hypothetical protein
MPQVNPNPRMPDDDSPIQGKIWILRPFYILLRDWTPKCNEMTHLISEEMDHPLPWYTRFRMQAHYLMCCYCKRYKENLHYLRYFLQRLHDHLDEFSTVTLPPEFKEQMKQVLRDERGGL